MSKAKLFIENFLVYGFGGIIQKIIPLIMVPIVTRIMTDSLYFGISDMSGTIVSFASALAIMGMYDAMYRMFFEKDSEQYKKEICSTTLAFTLFTSIVIFILLLIFKDFLADKFLGSREYHNVIYLTAIATLVGSTNSIVAAPTRMQNKRKVFLVMNTLSPIISYSISIPLMLKGCFVIALPLAGAVSGIVSECVFITLNHNWFSFKNIKLSYLKPLFVIGIPLLPNFLIYWIFNASDKVMITNFLGTDATGLYSVGAKLGHASQLIYTAFASGWQFFAFSTMKENNQVKTNSKIFEYLGIISYVCSLFVFALAEPIYELLFTGDYVKGFIVSPYLFLAPLMQMLFQVAANQFLVVKKTWPNMFILSAGAFINIVLNIWLIPVVGIEGAAIASLIGYVISDVICVIVLCKMELMVVEKRFIFASLLTVAYILVWRLLVMQNIIISLLLAIVCSGILILIYKNDIYQLISKVRIKKVKKP